MCVHWNDFGKKNFNTRAIIIELKSKDPKVFDNAEFYLSTENLKEKQIPLGRIEELKQVNEDYFLYLFVESETLYDIYPKGKNFYGDDCYHIELANLIGQGKVIMLKEEKEIVLSKSKDFVLSVGPK